MIVSAISEATGLGESVLRLLLTIVSSYFVALFYRFTLGRPIGLKYASSIRNSYVVATGLGLSFFFNNISIIHSLITVLGTWLLMWFGNAIGNRSIGAALAFILNLGYLIVGYMSTATDDYDIDWTMPQCVLCLRMIGFAMDYMDGAVLLKSQKPEGTKVKDESPAPKRQPAVQRPPQKEAISFAKDCKLPILPSLFETIGYAYFFSAFLIGPQFSFSLYRKFITHSIYPDSKPPPGAYFYALKSFLLGALYLGVQQIGSTIFPMSYLLTKQWAASPLLERLAHLWAASKFAFAKYLGIWTLAEGSCALAGISFSGFDENGRAKWDGLANVEKWGFEFATSLSEIISSFNVNTNLWTKLYIFKRLMFLNNKNLSSLVSLFFLAIWHGTHAGYFLCFGLEFFDVEAEKRWAKRLSPYTAHLYDPKNKSNIGTQVLKRIHMFTCWFLQTCALHYAMVPFVMLRFDHSIQVFRDIYFAGHAIVLALLILDVVLPKPKEVKKVPEANGKLNNEIKVNGELSRDIKMNGHTKAH